MTSSATFGEGWWVEGQDAAEVLPNPVQAGGQTFAHQSHLDAYIAALHRDLQAVEWRLTQPNLTPEAKSEWQTHKRNVLAEIKRFET
jgi:hypothetical protein